MQENYKLDVRDRKILVELDEDARQSNNQIGKKVGLSKEVVKYRIDKMIENGVILRFHTVVNYFRIGIVKFKLYLRFTNTNKKKLEELSRYFYNHSKTEWVALTTGRWDMIIGFLVSNVNEFDDEIQAVLNKFSSHIQEKAVTSTLYLAHQTREFLNFNKSEHNISAIVYHTTKDPKYEIDKIDYLLLQLIANNARMPVTEIADYLKTTPRVVQYRLKELERKKIILAYKAHVNPKKLGRVFCKAIIYLGTCPPTRLQEFMKYSSLMEGTIWPQRVLGSWDFELDFELENYDRFQESIFELKENFPDLVRNHEFCIMSKEFKLDLFPGAKPSLLKSPNYRDFG